ncbi:hypothetical protein J4437_01110 [Candidatus Woesearchaeota archaeon]|nr:hypothetical protein [Candidatus Woesearchaeota archaeon]
MAKNATSHGENSGSPKESGRASGRAKRACHRSLTGGAAFLFDRLTQPF